MAYQAGPASHPAQAVADDRGLSGEDPWLGWSDFDEE